MLIEVLENSFEFAQIIYGIPEKNYKSNFSKLRESNDQFLKIVPLNEISKPACDCIIEITYGSGSTSDSENITSKDYEEEVEDGCEIETVTEYVTNTEGILVALQVEKEVPAYKTISATVKVIERTRTSRASADMNVIKQTNNCELECRSWSEFEEDSIRKVDISGDRAAIAGSVPTDYGIILESASTLENKVYNNLKSLVYYYLVNSY